MSSNEILEKQFNRLLKSGMRTYVVKKHAEDMINYAKQKGVDLELNEYSFLYTVKVRK